MPGFGSSVSATGTGAGTGAWWNTADTMGGTRSHCPRDPRLLSEVQMTMMTLIPVSGMGTQRTVFFHRDEVSAQIQSPIRVPTDVSNRFKIMQRLLGSWFV